MSARNKKTALIAMSGGVDSSVAAWLMLREGYDCMGVTMRLFRNPDIGRSLTHACCSLADIDDAAEVAFQLDIPHAVPDFTAEFRKQVMEKFVRVYENGGTPNPCIDCNRYLKFDRLVKYADEQGMEYVVTGHYARIEYDREKERYLLKKALDRSKDQSYVLYMLTQEQLERIRFPLGGLRKSEVREIAERQGFCNARKHDSQDICFVPDGDYGRFLETFTGSRRPEGAFLDENGRRIGTHRGAEKYTIGQRRGLGVAAGGRLYVVAKDMESNTVTLGPDAALYRSSLLAGELNWISGTVPDRALRCKAKTRYRQTEQWASVDPLGEGRVRVMFDEPQRAIAPGQAVVFYDGDTVLGGGTILEA